MAAQSRLNLLLTHSPPQAERQPWYEMLAHLLAPLGVRTFEATSGPQAMELIETNPIHLAVVDTRLSATDGLGLLRLLQRIRERAEVESAQGLAPEPGPQRAEPEQRPGEPPSYRVQVQCSAAAPGQRIEVRFEAHGGAPRAAQVVWPTVILVTPRQDQGVLQEALKFNAFSVMNEPVDVNLMLEIMARAMRRFHQNQWPQ